MTKTMRHLGSALLALTFSTLPGCAGWAVAGTTLASFGSGAAGYGCYGYVQVTPTAGLGQNLCDAQVVARRGDDRFELAPRERSG